MRVILLQDVKKQGKKGDILNVKDGYGNYLITNNLAVLETTGSKKVLKKQQDEAKSLKEQQIKEAKKIKEQLEKMTLEFKVKTGKADQVFGSISTKQISNMLLSKNIYIDKRKIKIETPINTLGVTNIKIELYKDIEATLKINLTK